MSRRLQSANGSPWVPGGARLPEAKRSQLGPGRQSLRVVVGRAVRTGPQLAKGETDPDPDPWSPLESQVLGVWAAVPAAFFNKKFLKGRLRIYSREAT